jgi:hypothetical protein
MHRKYNAIVTSGIPILKVSCASAYLCRLIHPFFLSDMTSRVRFELGHEALTLTGRLDHLIPPDSRVEIDAKIAAGYFSSGRQVTESDLSATVGRTWEEVDVALHDII